MTEAKVAVVEEMFAAWNARDYAKAQEAFNDEIEFEAAIGSDMDGTYRGREEFLGAMQSFWREFENRQSTVEEYLTSGDEVVATLHHRASGRTSGAEVEMRHWQVYTVRDGKIVRYRVYADRTEALEAAGLSE